ncbi:hypothetical protein IU412_24440 [Nocardia cyriacigeorgica]|nr:hypothetical protein C5B73_06490 [Nocardia cyriacigeorgica]MBF6499376.1 hypothetical protein [Nocardia cyriacigeorgica]PPJ07671.1 hypothetical protein C5E43_18115 [Nocardia cyriacigeorgica]TLF58500.1 hypothetical protein FEK31_09815 [Nocardia cyriacigeorgica]
MVRRGIPGGDRADLGALAERHGYRLVFTIGLDVRPLVAAMALAQHLGDHAATAVVVPTFEHAEPYRMIVTELADLITPVRFYPRGHRWPAAVDESRRR